MTWLQSLDTNLLFFIQAHLVTPLLAPIMLFFSTIGDKGMLWLAIGALLLVKKKYRPAGIAVLLAVGMGFVVGNLTLKPLLARPRPCWLYPEVPLLLPVPDDFSFPSGHTLASFAAATALFQSNKKFGVPALIVAAVIGFSRLYLFVHFPSDVLCGAALGVLCGTAAVWLVKHTLRKGPQFPIAV